MSDLLHPNQLFSSLVETLDEGSSFEIRLGQARALMDQPGFDPIAIVRGRPPLLQLANELNREWNTGSDYAKKGKARVKSLMLDLIEKGVDPWHRYQNPPGAHSELPAGLRDGTAVFACAMWAQEWKLLGALLRHPSAPFDGRALLTKELELAQGSLWARLTQEEELPLSDLVENLESLGLDPSWPDSEGRTLLFYAPNPEIVHWVGKKTNLDPLQKDQQGQTAYVHQMKRQSAPSAEGWKDLGRPVLTSEQFFILASHAWADERWKNVLEQLSSPETFKSWRWKPFAHSRSFSCLDALAWLPQDNVTANDIRQRTLSNDWPEESRALSIFCLSDEDFRCQLRKRKDLPSRVLQPQVMFDAWLDVLELTVEHSHQLPPAMTNWDPFDLKWPSGAMDVLSDMPLDELQKALERWDHIAHRHPGLEPWTINGPPLFYDSSESGALNRLSATNQAFVLAQHYLYLVPLVYVEPPYNKSHAGYAQRIGACREALAEKLTAHTYELPESFWKALMSRGDRFGEEAQNALKSSIRQAWAKQNKSIMLRPRKNRFS